MKVEQKIWTTENSWKSISSNNLDDKAQLVFVFGDTSILQDGKYLKEIKGFYPKSIIVGCTTAGEILGEQVHDNSIVVTAIFFEKSKLQLTKAKIEKMEDSQQAGKKLAESLEKNGLTHVFILSDGLNVNGSSLVEGLRSVLPDDVAVTGGLAGDQARFEKTLVFSDIEFMENTIIAIGFYGDKLKIGYGSMGGWTSFGIDRLVTRSKGNVLYELDGQNALELYEKYLGDKAVELPASGLLFPLSIRMEEEDKYLVRTILGVDKKEGSMTFAGDITEGNYVRFMKASCEQLVEGAADAARMCSQVSSTPTLALLISCVGRKLVLKQRTEEELEIISEEFGSDTSITGFYSYGEICPFTQKSKQYELHNQTMTITTISEE